MTKVALIDGDSFLYRAGFAVERTKYLVEFCDPVTLEFSYVRADHGKEAKEQNGTVWLRKELGSVQDAISTLDSMIRRVCDQTGCTDKFVYLSPSGGVFRDAVATLRRYKGNRDHSGRPIYYSDLREHLLSAHSAIVARNEEADDQISWISRQLHQKGTDFVIVSIDKDLKQIPGAHYNWVQDEYDVITEDEALLNFWSQVLSGDEGDNVGGCWGLGDKGARKFLVQCNSLSDAVMWPKVIKKYADSQKKDGCPYKDALAAEVALETARLVRLRQKQDEPLWQPDLKEDSGKEKCARSVGDQASS